MKKLSLFLAAAAVILPLCLSGCVQYVELSERVIVQAVGVDYIPDKKVYRVSMQYFTQSGEGGQNQIDKTQSNVLKSVGEGSSVYDAAENASIKTGKDLLFSENRLIIIGSELTKYDLESSLEFFIGNLNSHPKAHIAVAYGTAEEIIDIRFKEGTVSTEKLVNLIVNSELHGVSPSSCLFDTLISLHSSSRSAYLPLLKVVEEKTDVTMPPGGSGGGGGQGGSGGDDEMKEKTVELVGGAAFSGGIGAGEGSMSDSAGIQLVNNQTQALSISTRTDDKSKSATITLFKINFTTTPTITDGKLTFKIDGFALGRFEERIFLAQSDDEGINEIKRNTEQSVVDCVSGAIEKIKNDYGCDVFGFEKILRHCMPDYWFDNQDNINEIIRQADVEISFECQPYILGLEDR
ncbi:MAG: Ger(x)C family spore germination protein [Eubacterium sp.]|nr:Ger(x)C family spore germination protein [Eubacterium sp.]